MTEMQHQPETEKVAMTNTSYMVVRKPLSLAEDREVQRTRKILTIILGVCLGLSVSGLIYVVSEPEYEDETGKINPRGALIGQAIISILFFAFGIFVTHRYSATGLRVFAWLFIIQLVVIGIGMVIGMIISFSDAETRELCAAFLLLPVIIVKLSFKLARAIDANQRLIIEQA